MTRAMPGRMRWPVAGAAAAVVAIAALLLAPGRMPAPTPSVFPSPSASAAPPTGPIVYYEFLDARASVLVEQRLDGTTAARRIAERPDAIAGRTWSVDPAATLAVSSVVDGETSHLAAVSIPDGQSLWAAELPAIDIGAAVWSADGRRLAALARPVDAGQPEALVIDTRDGRVIRTAVGDDASVQGFDADDALVLRRRSADASGRVTWQFLRIDPASNVIQPLPTAPSIGPKSDGVEDVDPGAGVAVTVAETPQEQRSAVVASPLNGGGGRPIATFASIDRLAIDPTGRGVAVAITGGIRFVSWDGTPSELWSGEEAVDDFAWSADARFLAVVSGGPDATVSLVEIATGRSVTLPTLGRTAAAAIARVVGAADLPANPLASVAPTPSVTQAPAGDDIAGAPPLAMARLERVGARWQVRVDRLVATSGGGMRAAGSTGAIDVGPAVAEPNATPEIRILPRPRHAEVLIWVEAADGSGSHGWLWNGTAAARPVGLPRDWPGNATNPHWSPDGTRLAATTELAIPGPDVVDRFVVAAIGGTRTTVLAEPADYPLLEGWWSATELRLGHAICTEGCPGRYAWSARLRIRDRHLVQLGPADRGAGSVDSVDPDGHGGLVISPGNRDSAHEIAVDWPFDGSRDGPTWVAWFGGERVMVVASETATATDLYRIVDPIGRAVKGRLVDPQPTLLGRLPPHLTSIRVTDGGHWAITQDRVGDIALQELASGRTWSLDGDATLEWWRPSG
jgi:WD40-like Beta Propeller Repeat